MVVRLCPMVIFSLGLWSRLWPIRIPPLRTFILCFAAQNLIGAEVIFSLQLFTLCVTMHMITSE